MRNGQRLLVEDPRQAASELLASYQLDERTETLTLYATALQRDKQYALALETWQRILLFREAEIEAARELMKKRKTAAAGKQQKARAEEASEHAAAQVMTLWSSVGRVQLATREQVTVRRGGSDVDATKDILVNAGRDELLITRADGSQQTLTVEVAAGQTKRVTPSDARISTTTAGDAPRTAPVPRPVPSPVPRIEREPASPIVRTQTATAPRSPGMRRVGIGIAAAGVVGLGIATTFGILAATDYAAAEDLGCNGDGQCPVGDATTRAERSNDRARIAQISGIAGGALLVGGAALWFVGGRPREREVQLAITPSATQPSFSLTWSLP